MFTGIITDIGTIRTAEQRGDLRLVILQLIAERPRHGYEIIKAIEERVALSDRFGLWLSFYPFGQDDYLAAARSWVEQAGLAFGDDARAAALLWAQTRGNRSGRVAYQFACDWVGTQAAAQRRNA